MASVGSLAVQLTASSTGLTSEIKRAEKRLSAFAQTVGGGGIFRTVGAGLGAAGGAVDSFFTPLKGLLGTIPLVGGTLASFPTTLGGIASAFKEGSDAILETDKVAKKLGVDVSEVGPILAVAGGASEGFARALFKVQTKLQGLTEEDKSAEIAFGRLGLTMQNFQGLTVTQQIGLIADRINALPNATQRAAAAFNLFGKTGAEILPLLARGSAGLEAAAARMQRLGFGVSSADVEMVREAKKAIKEIDLAFAGMRRQLAIGLAPLVSSLADGFKVAGNFAQDFANTTIDALEQVAGSLAFLAGKGKETFEAFMKFRDTIAQKRLEATNERIVAKKFTQAEQFKNAGGLFGPTLQLFAPDAQKRAEEEVERFRKRFGREPRNLGPNAAGARFDTFERASKIIDSQETPLDKFNKRISEIQKLVGAGAGQWEDYALSIHSAVMELDKANKVEGPAALFQGSAAAISAVNRAQLAAQGQGSAQERIERLLRQAKEQQERQTAAAKDTAEAVRRIFKRGI